ncbi:MAG: 50S ribosomal protein L10 [Thermoguttaceae bacterium]|nr:50S ribosomal protein L10 [Thermoguttaceae bacterium]MDW8079706.1 50S ribosomal protein L10 [Thermoguttaceae bacterium]
MSKYVKALITESYRKRLAGVSEAVLVNVIGMKANATVKLRAQLRQKGINLLVVKNSLACRATAGTPLAPLFDGISGPCAICWGGDDIVTLAKEIVRMAKDDAFKPFQIRRGLVAGRTLAPEELEEVSKWPTRQEQLSMLVGQIIGVGGQLAAQLTAPAGRLASQIEKLSKPSEAPAQSAG